MSLHECTKVHPNTCRHVPKAGVRTLELPSGTHTHKQNAHTCVHIHLHTHTHTHTHTHKYKQANSTHLKLTDGGDQIGADAIVEQC